MLIMTEKIGSIDLNQKNLIHSIKNTIINLQVSQYIDVELYTDYN